MILPKNKIQFVVDKPTCSFGKSRFIIIPIPYERTTSYAKGTRKGPKSVIEASLQLEFYDEETGRETWKDGIFTAKPFKIPKTEKAFFANLEFFVSELLKNSKAVPFFIGGEHSISQALIPPFAKKWKNLSVLHFDAHADLRDSYEGTKRNHACAMRPIAEFLKIVQIGIRNIAPEEKKYINSENVRTHLMRENLNIAELIKKILPELSENVYLSIDADGFDPSVMPGAGTPQPGGFMWYDALKIFKSVCAKKHIVGADMVEVLPLKDNPITEFAAAKLIYRLMGYIASKK